MIKGLQIALVIILAFAGCRPEQDESIPSNKNAEEMMLSLVGMKYQFAVGKESVLFNAITINGMTTTEITTRSDGDIDLSQLRNGYNSILSSNGYITRLWRAVHSINKSSLDVMVNSKRVSDTALGNSIYILGAIYRALALGTGAMFWKEIPVEYGSNAVFSSRDQALSLAVSILDSANNKLRSTTIPPYFFNRVGYEIDLRNTIFLLLARYHNMLNNHAKAIEFALQSDPLSRSVYFYNALNPNPIFIYGSGMVTGFRAVRNCGLPTALPPDLADKRLGFYLQVNNAGLKGFFSSDSVRIPFYVPGERLLILAESYVLSNPQLSKQYLDSVLMKKPAQDIYNLGADLGAYAGPIDPKSLKNEIFRNRCLELYMSGQRLEDARRLGIDTSVDKRTRNFMLYPRVERDGNINTPADPSF